MNGDLKKIAQSVIEDVISDRITLNDYKKAIEILAKALNEVLDLPSAELIVKTAEPANNSNIQTIYTDGACSGNPGPGGYGVVVIRNEEPEVTYSEGYKLTTNNRMELMAAIYALGVDKDITVEKKIFSDSKYVTDAVNKGWLESWKKKVDEVYSLPEELHFNLTRKRMQDKNGRVYAQELTYKRSGSLTLENNHKAYVYDLIRRIAIPEVSFCHL